MAVATLAVIAVVLTVLPWQALWTPKSNDSAAAPQESVGPVPADPAPQEPPTVTRSVLPETNTVQSNPQDLPAGQLGQKQTPAPEVKVQPTPPAQEPRRPKKMPIVAAVPQQGASIMQASAQGQGQQPTPPGKATEPVLISQVQPMYTQEAREARIQGTIEIQFTVKVDGTVKVERIVRGLGYGLDEAATSAVEQWKFIPGKIDGKPVAVIVNALVNFALK